MNSRSNFRRCTEKVAAFKASLEDRVDPRDISSTAKIPFQAIWYREALLHRMAELSENAIDLFRNPKNAVSAIILTRAAQETFSLLFVLYFKINQVTSSKKLGDFHEYLMTYNFGYRTEGDDELPKMPNILNSINKVDKVLEVNFSRSYEGLSEYCHPNCAGVHSSYVTIDRENIWADIGSTHTEESIEPLIGALIASLERFEQYYNEISELSEGFIGICENELKKT
jgi:hypothetical protein